MSVKVLVLHHGHHNPDHLREAAKCTAYYFQTVIAWPHGLEANRPTIAPFLTLCHGQGVTRRKLDSSEFFAKEVRT